MSHIFSLDFVVRRDAAFVRHSLVCTQARHSLLRCQSRAQKLANYSGKYFPRYALRTRKYHTISRMYCREARPPESARQMALCDTACIVTAAICTHRESIYFLHTIHVTHTAAFVCSRPDHTHTQTQVEHGARSARADNDCASVPLPRVGCCVDVHYNYN